jgi:hypothetical protein
MAIILDADVIIRGEKGTFDLKNWLLAQPDELFEVATFNKRHFVGVPGLEVIVPK